MNKWKKYFLLLFFFCWAQQSKAYIQNQTKSGIPLHWSSSHTTVDLYVNSQNEQSLLEESVQEIARSSITSWNESSQMRLRKNATQGKGQSELNELYFSKDPEIFNGTGVIGITQVAFKDTDGEIISGDILINDNYTFSTTSSDLSYLGNVVTHEVGHFLGLGHGQVQGSTMFYALTRGQYNLKDDDKAGIYTTYPTNDESKGSLTGMIVGGKKLIGVFGAHVQAISIKTGKIMGASISDSTGKFIISGLPRNDQFLIYTSPIKQLGLPTNYAGVKSDFCESSKKYRGSFFQSCGSRTEGFPESVGLNSNSQDVGKITIRCGVDSPPEYFQTKGETPSDFDINSYANTGYGGSFVGFFSTSEINEGTHQDYFRINLSHINNWDVVSSSASLYLELKVLNQGLYSPFKANVSLKRLSGTSDVLPKYIQGIDGWLSLDTTIRVPINRSNPSDNTFEVSITPEDMQKSFPSGIPKTLEDYFPAFSDLKDDLYFYLATATIVKKNDDGSYTQVASRVDSLLDNSQCPDGINTYALTSYTVQKSSSDTERKKTAGCGTVDMDNGTKGGPGGFAVGLLLSFILAYGLSRYSKLA